MDRKTDGRIDRILNRYHLNFVTIFSRVRLTLKAICVEEIFALFVAFDATFGAAYALSGDAPQQTLALIAVRRRRRRPHHEIMRRRA